MVQLAMHHVHTTALLVLLLPADMCWTVMRLLLTNKNDLWRPPAALTTPTGPPMVPMG